MATTTIITPGQYIVPGYPFGTATALVANLTTAPNGTTIVEIGGMALLADVLQGGTGLLFNDPQTFGGIAPDNTANGGPTVIVGAWPTTTFEPLQQTPIMNYCVIDSGMGLEIFRITQVISDTVFVVQGTVSAPATQVLFLSDKGYGAKSVGITCSGAYLMGGLNQALVSMPAGSITVGYGDDRVEPFLVSSIADDVNITLEAMVLGGAGGGGGGGGAVNSVTASAPVVSSGGANPNISMPAATSLVNGYLKSADWSTFNNKVSSVGATAPVTSTGGTTPVIAMAKATSLVDGYLSSADWTTFNNKLGAAITTLGTAGNGQTGATQTLATGTTGTDFAIVSAANTHTFNLPTASATNRGALSSADWTTFNSKEPALTKGNLSESTSSVLTITGGTGSVIGAGTTIEVKQSSAGQSGYLSSADWSTFNNKLSAAITSLGGQTGATQTFATGTTGTDFGISSAANTHTFNLPTASATVRGALSSSDWTTFNNKLSAAIVSLGGLTGATQTLGTGTTGTDFAIVSSGTSHTFNLPTASATNRGALSSADWTTFNSKQSALTFSTGLNNAAGTVTATLRTGLAGGQTVIGGTASGENLTLSSTTNATKGKILFGTSAYDEVNNRLGIGTTSPSGPIEILSESLTVPPVLNLSYYADSQTNAGGFLVSKARGSVSSPTAILSDDVIAGFFARGYHSGGAFGNNTAAIRFVAAQNFTSTAQGTKIEIATTNNGTNIRSTKLTVFDSGNVLIQNGGTFTDAGFRLDVNGTARVQERLTVSDDSTVTTQTVAVITTDTTNAGLVLRPNGTGAIMANAPDGTSTGGNARGTRAVDLQMERTANTQVASGSRATIGGGGGNINSSQYGTIAGGWYNNASGQLANTIGGGEENIASASYCSVSGGYQARAIIYGQRANAAGQFAATGDAQTSAITLRRSITGVAAQELFLDGSSARAILNIASPGPTNARAWRAQIDLVAIVQTVGNGTVTLGDCFMGSYHVGIKRIGTATSLVGTVNVANEVNDAGMAGAAATITADDTNEALKIEFTPATNAGSTTVTRVVATAYLTEVGY